MFSPGLRRALWVGIGLAVFQQITGINAIIYYANEIFARGRLHDRRRSRRRRRSTRSALVERRSRPSIAVAWIDRFGRRPLLFTGLVGMAVEPGRGRRLVRRARATRRAAPTSDDGRGHRHRPRARRLHRVVRVLDGPDRVDDHLRDLPEPSARQGDRVRHCRQLVAPRSSSRSSSSRSSTRSASRRRSSSSPHSASSRSCGVFRVPETRGRSLEEIQELWAPDGPAPARSSS